LFLQNQLNLKVLKDFFALSDKPFCPQSRPVECFFHDIQRTTEEENLENLQLYLLAARKSIYQGESGIGLDILAEYGWNRYIRRLQKASFFFECCHTLTYAEKQQKAFERQLTTNRQEGPSFFAQEDTSTFFEELYEIKTRHGFCAVNISRDVWIQGCANLYNKCRSQPIPAMLLPVLLTIYSTDGKEFSNLYAYFKYKNRRFSIDTQKQVVSLFQEVCEAVTKHISKSTSFVIPIFHWLNIENAFCLQKGLTDDDAEIVKQYFDEYCNKNDLSKADEGKLLKFSYGSDIRSLAKLCNLNTYIMMNQLPTENMPAKAKRPLRLLTDGKLLPKVPHMENQRIFDQYFCNLYQKVPAIPAFSQLALLRYYRLPLDFYLDTEPDFFPDIEEGMVAAISHYSGVIQHSFWPQQVIRFRKAERYNWLNRRANARIQYKLGNILDR